MALWGKVDNEASKPKYLSDELRNDQEVSDKDATLGVDRSEAAIAGNRAKGLKTPGWTQYSTYVDGNGNTRHKAETLVVLTGNFTGGDNDTVDPDPVITIGTQPSNQEVDEGEDATFTVSATATRGATLSYQWQENIETVWTNVSGATSVSFTVSETELADDGRSFRVIVSAVGATSVTSNAATLTVNELPPEEPNP